MPISDKNIRIQVTLSKEDATRLLEICKFEGKTRSELGRELFEKFLRDTDYEGIEKWIK